MMREVVMQPRVLLLVALLFGSIGYIAFSGIPLGVDFKGGTLFSIELAQEVKDPAQLGSIKSIIQSRMDALGLKDTKVSSWGNRFIIAQIAETDPAEIASIEDLLRTQGKFDATLDGNLLFSGKDIRYVIKDPKRGYGIESQGTTTRWNLPFKLSDSAARNFAHLTFHQCNLVSFSGSKNEYECPRTYFFIDRPQGSILIMDSALAEEDTSFLLSGNEARDIPAQTSMTELLQNAKIPYLNVDENLSAEQTAQLAELVKTNPTAIVPSSLSKSIQKQLSGMGFSVVVREASPQRTVPWVWEAVGAQSIISLTESVTNQEPFVEDISKARIFSDLFITGGAASDTQAKTNLDRLTILLETGSLDVPISSISKETISSFLGKDFLNGSMLIGLLALVAVALVIFLRYRHLELVIPILFTSASEVVLILGFASLVRWNLDLGAVAGILAAVGTGVDNQIIITDELLRNSETQAGSLVERVKRAFFTIMASAATILVTMLPVFLGFEAGKLRGFAFTTMMGVLIGILLTRPAYGTIAQKLLKK